MPEPLTPTQQRLMAVLNDGRAHTKGELLVAVGDGEATADYNLRNHITILRKKLAPQGLNIVCNERGETSYQLTRNIGDGE
jgi:DNA-binding response OmpR family regulator